MVLKLHITPYVCLSVTGILDLSNIQWTILVNEDIHQWKTNFTFSPKKIKLLAY